MQKPLPHVLVLHSDNVGDRNQAETLARLLGWPYRLHYLSREEFSSRKLPDTGRPKPDVIITINRPCTGLALRLKRRSPKPIKVIKIGSLHDVGPKQRSAGKTFSDDVDLYILYGLYRPVVDPRIIRQELPFSPVNAEALEAGRQAFPHLAGLPAPRIAVLLGGTNRYFEWSPQVAAEMGRRLDEYAAKMNGSLMITTSYRTGADNADALERQLKVPHLLYRWGGEGQNPLHAFLGYADQLVVTMDSVAMIADALNTGKPVSVYPLVARRWPLLKKLAELVMPLSGRTAIVRKLEKSGEITWFGNEPRMSPDNTRGRYDDAVNAVRRLVLD